MEKVGRSMAVKLDLSPVSPSSSSSSLATLATTSPWKVSYSSATAFVKVFTTYYFFFFLSEYEAVEQ